MNIALWITQILLVVVFGYSALIKGTQSTERAVQLGMTGVVNVPLPVMRFTAYCEVFGVIGLIVPYATGVLPILTPLAAMRIGDDHGAGGKDSPGSGRAGDGGRQHGAAGDVPLRCVGPVAGMSRSSTPAGPRPMTRVLPWLATGVTVGTLPYVVLKISWLAGGELGYETRR